MLEDPAYHDLGHLAFADLLNRKGILSGQNSPRTEEGIKRQRRLAKKRIDEQAELKTALDAEEEIEKSADVEPVLSPLKMSPVQPAPENDGDAGMESKPFVCMFQEGLQTKGKLCRCLRIGLPTVPITDLTTNTLREMPTKIIGYPAGT